MLSHQLKFSINKTVWSGQKSNHYNTGVVRVNCIITVSVGIADQEAGMPNNIT